jgi:hypothetical protein
MEQMIPQLVFVALVIVAVVFFTVRAKRKGASMGNVQSGVDAVRAGFAASRAPDETDPVCVVAYHYGAMSATQVTVGVTNRRVLVVKGGSPMQSFPYDAEGEHLPSKEKTANKRGFFRWSHGTFPDGSKGYSPTVNNYPPFTNEEWRMYPELPGFPEQTANLKEFSRLFYFQWFYN